MAIIVVDTRALPFLEPDASALAIILDARGRLDTFDRVNDAIVQEQQRLSRRQHPAIRAHVHAV